METLLLVCVSLAVVLVASLLFLLHRHGDGRKDGKVLPPGPPVLVFLAKFLVLRRSIFDLGPLLLELHSRHGPVISVRLMRTLVFVADRRLAHRALVQGGAIFADRPPPIDPSLMIMFNGDIGSSPYGAYWRLVRRNLTGEALQTSRVSLFAPARQRVCDKLVTKLLQSRSSKEDKVVVTLRPLLRRAMFELLVYMCFGAWLDDESLGKIEQLQHQILLCVTSFPIFAFFPSITKRIFHRRWAELVAVRRRQEQLFLRLIHHHSSNSKRQQAQDPPPPSCYADTLLKLRVPDEEGDRPLTDSEMVSLCAEFLDGGTDTTVTLVEWIMAELVNNPDIQAKLRHELVQASTQGGGDDLDRNLQEMPYLKAVVMEGLRLHPPGHFVLPHGVQTDADIRGYTVPKGAELNFLVAKMGRDDTVWPTPMEFRPERFLDGGEGSGVDITGSREIKIMPFGAGRRMCPGYALGMHHAEYFVARMVRDLQWLPPPPPVDVQGQHQQAVDMEEVLDHTTVMKHPLHARIVILPSHK